MLLKQWEGKTLLPINKTSAAMHSLCSVTSDIHLHMHTISPFSISIDELMAMPFPRRVVPLSLPILESAANALENALNSLSHGFHASDLLDMITLIPQEVRTAARIAKSTYLENSGDRQPPAGLSCMLHRPRCNNYYRLIEHPLVSMLTTALRASHDIQPEIVVTPVSGLFIDPADPLSVNARAVHYLRMLERYKSVMARVTTMLNTLTWLYQNMEADGSVINALAVALATEGPDWDEHPVQYHLYAAHQAFIRYLSEVAGRDCPSTYRIEQRRDLFIHNVSRRCSHTLEGILRPGDLVYRGLGIERDTWMSVCVHLLYIEDDLQRRIESDARLASVTSGTAPQAELRRTFITGSAGVHASMQPLFTWHPLKKPSGVWPEQCVSLSALMDGVASIPAFLAEDSLGITSMLVPASADCQRLLSAAYGLPPVDRLRQYTPMHSMLINVQSPDFPDALCARSQHFIYDGLINIEDYLRRAEGLDGTAPPDQADIRKLFHKFLIRE